MAPLPMARQDVIAAWPHVYSGPLLDTYRSQPDPDEFKGSELQQVGEAMAASVLALGL